MEDLRHVMRIIDDNSQNLSEGDYLRICNLLQNVYKSREAKEMTPIFDYENFNIYVPIDDDRVVDYFYDYFYGSSLDNDVAFLESQQEYLQNELERCKPIKRITKYVKTQAIKHYCWMHDVRLDDYTEECLKAHHDEHGYDLGDPNVSFRFAITNVYRSYMNVENQYRTMYSSAIRAKISKIDGWIQALESI